ncbi:MAG: hypothetical protein KDD60_00650, partial [Bdellovibrionales bacterium]|nr:hypothetical protein [Bdellovibrionales bacterium]
MSQRSVLTIDAVPKPQQAQEPGQAQVPERANPRDVLRAAAAEARKILTDQKSEGIERSVVARREQYESGQLEPRPATYSKTESHSSDRQTGQAEEDNRTAAAVKSRKRDRDKWSAVPQSLRSYLEMLESAVSESQVQQILKDIIEKRLGGGSAIEKNPEQIRDASKDLARHIQKQIGLGDRAESEELLRIFGKFFVEFELVQESEELAFFTGLIRTDAPETFHAESEKALTDRPYSADLLALVNATNSMLAADRASIEHPSQLAERLCVHCLSKTPWIDSIKEEGIERFLAGVSKALEEGGRDVITTEQSKSLARAVVVQRLQTEIVPILSQIALGEVVSETHGESVSQRDLGSFAGIVRALPEMEDFIEREIREEKSALYNQIDAELAPLNILADGITEALKAGKAGEYEVLAFLLNSDRTLLQLRHEHLEPLLADRGVQPLETALKGLFGREATARVLQGLADGESEIENVLAARLLALQIDMSQGEQRSERIAELVELLSSGDGAIARCYADIFGEVETQLTTEDPHATKCNLNTVMAAFHQDQELRWAVELEEITSEASENGSGASFSELSRFLERVPASLRDGVLHRAEQEFGNTTVRDFISNATLLRSERAGLEACLEDDPVKSAAVHIRLSQESSHHSFLTVLHELRSNSKVTLDSLQRSYEELFGEKLGLSDLRSHFSYETEERTPELERVENARKTLRKNVQGGQPLSEEALRIVFVHEGEQLANHHAREEVRSGWSSSYETERQKLLRLAESLDVDRGTLKVLADTAYEEALHSARVAHLSQEASRLGENCLLHTDGTIGTEEAKASGLRELNAFLDELPYNVSDELRIALHGHFEKRVREVELLIPEMEATAVRIAKIPRGIWSSDIVGIRREILNRECTRAIESGAKGFTKLELKVLHTVYPRVSHGGRLEDTFRSVSQGTNEKIQNALSPFHAPDDKSALIAFEFPSVPVDSHRLLQTLSSGDSLTQIALEFRKALRSENAVLECATILDRANAHEVLKRYKEIFGESDADIGNLIRVTEPIAVPSTKAEREFDLIDERRIIGELVRAVQSKSVNGDSILTQQTHGWIQQHAMRRLERFAREAGELEAGTLQTREVRFGCKVEFRTKDRDAVLAEAEEYQRSLASGILGENTLQIAADGRVVARDGTVLGPSGKRERYAGEIYSPEEFYARYFQGVRMDARDQAIFQNYGTLQRYRYLTQSLESTPFGDIAARNNQVVQNYLSALYEKRAHDSSLHEVLERLPTSDADLEPLRRETRETYRSAQDAVDRVHYELKGRWFRFMSMGEWKETVNSSLRGLDDASRPFAVELYALLHGDSLAQGIIEEMKGYEAAETFCLARGDGLSAEQFSMAKAQGYWWGKDATVVSASERAVDQLVQDARVALEGEVREKREAAVNAQSPKEKRQLLERALMENPQNNSILQSAIAREKERYWASFEAKFESAGISRNTILNSELSDKSAVDIVFLADNPDHAWALRLTNALKEDPETAAEIVHEQVERYTEGLLRARIDIQEDGTLAGDVDGDAFLVSSEATGAPKIRVTGEHVRDFLVQQAYAQCAQSDGVAASVLNEIEHLRTASLNQDFYAQFGIDLGKVGAGEAARQLLTISVTPPGFEVPNSENLARFEQFLSKRELAPRYRMAIANGTIFQDEEIQRGFESRIGELNLAIQAIHGSESVNLGKLLSESKASSLTKEWVKAQLDGDLLTAAACQVRRDITGSGKDVLAAEALLPKSLLQLKVLAERERAELLALSEQLPIGQQEEVARRIQMLSQEIDNLQKSVKERASKIEEIYDSRWQYRAHYQSAGVGAAPSAGLGELRGMWKQLALDIGSEKTKVYKQAIEEGELSESMRLVVAGAGFWTDSEAIFEILSDPAAPGSARTREDLEKLACEFCELKKISYKSPSDAYEELHRWVVGEVTGDEDWRARVLLVGKPDNAVRMNQVMELHYQHARGSLAQRMWKVGVPVADYWYPGAEKALEYVDGVWDYGGELFEEEYNKYREQELKFAARILGTSTEELEKLSEDEREKQLVLAREKFTPSMCHELEAHFDKANSTVNIAVMQRNAIADVAVEVAGTSAVVVGSVVLVGTTGGAGAIVLAGAFATTVRAGTGYVLKGGSYSGSNLAMDVGTGAFDTLTLGTGKFVNAGVRRASGYVAGRMMGATERLVADGGEVLLRSVATGGVEKTVGEVAEGMVRRRLSDIGAEAIEKRMLLRVLQNSVDGSIQGTIDSVLAGAYGQAIQRENFDNGIYDGVMNIVRAGSTNGVIGLGVGTIASPVMVESLRVAAHISRKAPIIRNWKRVQNFADAHLGKQVVEEPSISTDSDTFIVETRNKVVRDVGKFENRSGPSEVFDEPEIYKFPTQSTAAPEIEAPAPVRATQEELHIQEQVDSLYKKWREYEGRPEVQSIIEEEIERLENEAFQAQLKRNFGE